MLKKRHMIVVTCFALFLPLFLPTITFARTDAAIPGVPTGLTGGAENGHVLLQWTAVAGADSYSIYRATKKGQEGDAPYKTGITSTSFRNTIVDANTLYYYQISAVNADGESARSVEVAASPNPALNITPTSVPQSNVPASSSSNIWNILTIAFWVLLGMVIIGGIAIGIGAFRRRSVPTSDTGEQPEYSPMRSYRFPTQPYSQDALPNQVPLPADRFGSSGFTFNPEAIPTQRLNETDHWEEPSAYKQSPTPPPSPWQAPPPPPATETEKRRWQYPSEPDWEPTPRPQPHNDDSWLG